MSRSSKWNCVALISVIFCGMAQAQPLPGGALPGRIERDVAPPVEPRPTPSVVTVPAAPSATAMPAGAATQMLTLQGVELRGNTAIDTVALSAIWAERIGKSITLAQVYGIANAITARYREAGYVLSQAVVPPQDIRADSATVRLVVVEGFASKVSFTGQTVDAAALQPFVEPILAERPLTLKTLERQLLLLNELAGINARANLKAASTPGGTELDIEVVQQKIASSVSVHNRTSRSLGPWRFEAGTEIRGVLGAFDRHGLRWIGSGNSRLNLVSYNGETPIGASGLKVNWAGSVSRAKPLTTLVGIDSDSTSLSLGLSYPIVRSRAFSLGVRGALTSYRGSTDTPLGELSNDKLRVARIGMTIDNVDDLLGINLVDIEYAQGLSGSSLLGADTHFKKGSLYAARLQSLGSPWSLLLAVNGQKSSDVLASSEKFGLGGDVFLRAFDPSELLGDTGIAGKVELRYQLSFGAHESTVYLYQDVGRVTCNGAVACSGYTGPGKYSRSLTSTGAGVRFTLGSRLKGFVEIAKPHLKVVDSKGTEKPRVFAGLGFDF
ncbi:MAG: POTRA domain-containing protein [Patulibacter sp.]